MSKKTSDYLLRRPQTNNLKLDGPIIQSDQSLGIQDEKTHDFQGKVFLKIVKSLPI